MRRPILSVAAAFALLGSFAADSNAGFSGGLVRDGSEAAADVVRATVAGEGLMKIIQCWNNSVVV